MNDIARATVRAAERDAIVEVLKDTWWHRRRAATLLNIGCRSLLYKIKDAGLQGKRQAPDRP